LNQAAAIRLLPAPCGHTNSTVRAPDTVITVAPPKKHHHTVTMVTLLQEG
jgi:hypothetical protein